MKRILRFVRCVIGAVLLGILLFTADAYAASGEEEAYASCPTWHLDESGTLTISGTGKTEGTLGIEAQGDVFRIIVEEGVTGIGDRAFAGFHNAKYVTLPSTLETIGEESFCYCTAMSSLELPEGLKEIGKKAFAHSGLSEVTVPGSVKSLGEGAFSWSGIKNATLPEGIRSIPKDCFNMCTKLESVNIPSTVETIGESAFYYCLNLQSVELPEGLTSIEERAFSFSGMTEIRFPAALKSIGPSAFAASRLKAVVIPETVEEIGNGAFQSSQLIEVSLPNNMTKIPTELFRGCSLVRAYIPDGVTTIGYSAYKMCSQLSSIRIPVSVTKIESGAFWWCWGLKDVFYAGTEEEWEQIFIKDSNWDLTDATIHYNCVGAVDDPKSLRPLLFHAGYAEEGKQDYYLNITWTDELFLFDANQFHSELAIPCLALSGAVELPDGDNRAFDMLEDLDFERGRLSSGYFNTKYNYLKPAAVFGHKKIQLEGETKDLFVIVVRGTTAGTSDWMTDISGQVGGFAVASEDVKSRFMEYVEKEMGVSYEEVLAHSGDNVLLVTGHSLGGAVANHLSVDLMGFAPKDKSFFYTFAACQSFPLTDRKYRNEMTNVFNVINTADIVPYLPPAGFYRIGVNRCFSSNHYKVQETFARLTSGRTYSDAYHHSDAGFLWVPHAIETYMAFLINDDGKALLDARPILVRVECPVDVEVYDGDGVLVGRIVNNEIDTSVETRVGLFTDGDKKAILLSEEGRYTVVMTGTDYGEMTCTVETIDPETDEKLEEAAYSHVVLAPGKRFSTEIDTAGTAAPALFVIDENGESVASVSAEGEETDLREPAEQTPPEEDPKEDDRPADVSDGEKTTAPLAFLRELGAAAAVLGAVGLGVVVLCGGAVAAIVMIRRRKKQRIAKESETSPEKRG